MDTFVIIVILFLSLIIASYWGSILSTWLPDKWNKLDRKPFNCRPCLTFHLAWIWGTIGAAMIRSVELLVLGLISALILFLIVRYIDGKKIEP